MMNIEIMQTKLNIYVIRAANWYGGEEYLKKVQAHDAIKKQFAKDNNIRLVEVNYKNVLYSDVEKCLKDNFIY